MAGEFFTSFNAVLPSMEAMFGEEWIHDGITYPAIAIDHETDSTKVMKGGSYQDVTTTIYVRKSVFLASGVKQDDNITARGQDFCVLQFDHDGDDSVTMLCASPQVDVWR